MFDSWTEDDCYDDQSGATADMIISELLERSRRDQSQWQPIPLHIEVPRWDPDSKGGDEDPEPPRGVVVLEDDDEEYGNHVIVIEMA